MTQLVFAGHRLDLVISRLPLVAGMHTTGEQLDQLTGLAAILRFPLPDLEDAEFEPDGTRIEDTDA